MDLQGNLLYDLNEQHQQLNVIYLSEPFMEQKDIGEVEVRFFATFSKIQVTVALSAWVPGFLGTHQF